MVKRKEHYVKKHTRMVRHKDKSVYQNLIDCSEFQYIVSINRYNDIYYNDQNLGLDINQDLYIKKTP